MLFSAKSASFLVKIKKNRTFALDMKNNEKSPVYSRDAIELVTVAVEYCVFLERASEKNRFEFVDTILKLLPLLYLKAALLPKYEIMNDDFYPTDFVTEDNYNIVRANICNILGDRDDFLDVFMEDMKYSESPILTTISENLADIYQELKNFAMTYKNAPDERLMLNTLASIKDDFQFSWGQKLVNVQRALHEVRYTEEDDF